MSRHVVQCKQSVLVSARVMVGVVTAGPAPRRIVDNVPRWPSMPKRRMKAVATMALCAGGRSVAHTLSAMYSYSTVYGNPVTYFSFIAVARLAFPRISAAQQIISGESKSFTYKYLPRHIIEYTIFFSVK